VIIYFARCAIADDASDHRPAEIPATRQPKWSPESTIVYFVSWCYESKRSTTDHVAIKTVSTNNRQQLVEIMGLESKRSMRRRRVLEETGSDDPLIRFRSRSMSLAGTFASTPLNHNRRRVARYHLIRSSSNIARYLCRCKKSSRTWLRWGLAKIRVLRLARVCTDGHETCSDLSHRDVQSNIHSHRQRQYLRVVNTCIVPHFEWAASYRITETKRFKHHDRLAKANELSLCGSGKAHDMPEEPSVDDVDIHECPETILGKSRSTWSRTTQSTVFGWNTDVLVTATSRARGPGHSSFTDKTLVLERAGQRPLMESKIDQISATKLARQGNRVCSRRA